MIYIIIYSLVCFTITRDVSAVNLFPATNLPDADILIDNEKGFLLQRIGVYSPKLHNAILHTVISLHDFCQASPTSDICLRSSKSKEENIIELGTIMSSRQASPLVSQYKKHDVSKLIHGNITDLLSNHQLGEFFENTKPSFHFFNNHFYAKVNDRQSLQSTSNDNIVVTQHAHSYFSKVSTTAVIEQIRRNRIGFSFLSDEEIAVFLSPLMSSIDKSYVYSSMEDLMNEFSRLIIAQLVHVLHSCSMLYQDIDTYPPCLIISTLFIRPPPLNSFTYTIYNLYPLPVVVNENRYVYTNLPRTFGLNSIDETLIIWNDDQKRLKCIFSKVVQCEEEPTYVPLSSLPCMVQLFSSDGSNSNACEIAHSINSQYGIINIVESIWIFYNLNEVKRCNMYLYENNSIEVLTVNEPSVVRLPCETFVKCSDIQLKSSTCKKDTTTIKSLRSGIGKTISSLQYSIKELTSRLESEYSARAIKSFQQLQLDLYRSTPTWTKILQASGSLLIYFLLLIVSIIIGVVVNFIETKITKKVNKIEKQMNKYSDVFSLELETV
ncbi:unnamed protein product [Rotaria magnacalcarata]|uniref:Envelope protein n=1 Tax=Rotaria magnacalcarata TaxID=392030 RepID=A0A816PC33_9BILA